MRPVKRGAAPTDGVGNPVVFTDYKQARDPLIMAIGDDCSYCENALHSSIDVEHVQPKKGDGARPDLELTWGNFLLACDYCNSIKGHKAIVLDDYFWPDCDNTFRAYLYAVDQPPVPADGLSVEHRKTALRTIELTGLDRVPGHAEFSDRDRRHIKRKEAWSNARIALTQYEANRLDPIAIAHWAASRGFFSIWMTVFREHPEVRKVLISQFKADANCFDAITTEPKPRVGGQL